MTFLLAHFAANYYFCSMIQLYNTLDAFLAPGILIGLAVCLFFLYIPPKAALRNYRMARYVMGAAYLLYAIAIYMEYHIFGVHDDKALTRPIILSVAFSQAFLFTFTLITLIRLNYLSAPRVAAESAPIVTIVAAFFVSRLSKIGGSMANAVFWLSVVIYIMFLVKYVLLFNREYKRYETQMDHFFSDEASHRLLWVKRSFYASLCIGILALVYALLPYDEVGMVFMLIVVVFYCIFGVRFINYVLHFQSIETAITTEQEAIEREALKVDPEMMRRIDALMDEEKLFRKNDLSVSDLAERLGERQRAVSAVISASRNINFKTYINEYRVAEAKRLLDEDKNNRRTIDAIAGEAGFANRSSFYRVFKKMEGISPTDYRFGSR